MGDQEKQENCRQNQNVPWSSNGMETQRTKGWKESKVTKSSFFESDVDK